MAAAFLSSPLAAAAATATTAIRTLDFLMSVFRLDRRRRHHCTIPSSSSSSSSAAAADPPGGDLISFLLDVTKKIPDQNPNPSLHLAASFLPPDPRHYNVLMAALIRAGDPDRAVRLFREMKDSGCRPNLYCYSTAINALVSSSRWKEAHLLFDEMIQSGLIPDAIAFTVLLKMYALHLKQFDSAFEVLGRMACQGCDPSVVAYSTLIAGLCQAGRVEEAWRVLDHMLEEEKCLPNAHTFTPILQAYCSEGRIDVAKKFMDWMHRSGCPLDDVAYNVLIQGLCKAGDFDAVEVVLGESESKGWKPDVVSYNTFIGGLLKAGRTNEAFRQLEVMLRKGLNPNMVTLKIMLDFLCQDSRVWEAMTMLERSSELGPKVDVGCYHTVMRRLCKIGQWSAVLKMFTDMLKKGMKPDTKTCNIVIYGLCKGGKLRKARSIFQSKGFVPDVVTCNILIRQFYMAGMTAELQHVLSVMDMENIAPDTRTYSTMVDCLCKSGKIFQATDFVASLEDRCSPELVEHLAYCLVKGGRVGEFLRLLEEMLERGLVLECRMFHFLIKALCKNGSCQSKEIDDVCIILDMMLGIG